MNKPNNSFTLFTFGPVAKMRLLTKPQTFSLVPTMSETERRFSQLDPRDDERRQKAIWSCSSIQRGSHIDSLPLQKDDGVLYAAKKSDA
jgi:hypothetical protein